MSSPCQNCHAGCCRSFAVPVTGADVLEIQRQKGLTFWEFVCRWEDQQGLIAGKYAPHFHFADEPATPFVICLRQAPSELFRGTQKCVFLEEELPTAEAPLGRGKCGNYQSRPGACRAFPVKLDHERQLPIVYDVPVRGRNDPHPAYKLCPRQWTPDDIDPLTVTRDLATADFEMRFFHNVARVWNQHRIEWAAFPEFLELVYASRVVAERDEIAAKQQEESEAEAERQILKFPGASGAYRKVA